MKFIQTWLRLLILLWVSIVSLNAFSQASAAFEEKDLLMGDIARLRIDVPIPSDTSSVDFPALQKAVMEKRKYFSLLNDTVEILVDHTKSIESKDGKFWMRYNLLVQAFDSGKYTLPSFEFQVQGKPVLSNRVDLTVVPVKATAEDKIEPFSDVAPPFEINPVDQEQIDKQHRKNVFLWILFGVIILLAAALIFLYVRFLKTGKFIFSPKKFSADEVAVKALKKLRGQKLPQKGKTKEYYTRLADIIRTYLKAGFGVKTFEKTTTEILEQVEDKQELVTSYDILKSLLQTADFVKFAKVNPADQDNERSFEEALSFVEKSKNLTKDALEAKKGGKK